MEEEAWVSLAAPFFSEPLARKVFAALLATSRWA
jgi:hypothetical protein